MDGWRILVTQFIEKNYRWGKDGWGKDGGVSGKRMVNKVRMK